MSFDLRSEVRDPRSGRVVSLQPYTTYLSSAGVIYERDGVYYLEDGKEAPEGTVLSIVGNDAYKKAGIKKATTEAKK